MVTTGNEPTPEVENWQLWTVMVVMQAIPYAWRTQNEQAEKRHQKAADARTAQIAPCSKS